MERGKDDAGDRHCACGTKPAFMVSKGWYEDLLRQTADARVRGGREAEKGKAQKAEILWARTQVVNEAEIQQAEKEMQKTEERI